VAVDLLADFHAARAEVFRAPDERFPNLLLHDDAPLARLFLIQRVVFEWLRSGGAGGRGEGEGGGGEIEREGEGEGVKRRRQREASELRRSLALSLSPRPARRNAARGRESARAPREKSRTLWSRS
jgi:hypothetical protein